MKAPHTKRTVVWPAYLVAAACFVIALLTSIANIALLGELRQDQSEDTQLTERSTALARNLADVRSTLSDVLDPHASHYRSSDDEIVVDSSRIYVVVRNLSQLPRGRVYQIWIRTHASQKMMPSMTFVPNVHGIAVVELPLDARTIAEVAVSVEPDGGTKQMTDKPLIDISLVSA